MTTATVAGLLLIAVSLAFNTVPVERHEAGAAGASELEKLLAGG